VKTCIKTIKSKKDHIDQENYKRLRTYKSEATELVMQTREGYGMHRKNDVHTRQRYDKHKENGMHRKRGLTTGSCVHGEGQVSTVLIIKELP